MRTLDKKLPPAVNSENFFRILFLIQASPSLFQRISSLELHLKPLFWFIPLFTKLDALKGF